MERATAGRHIQDGKWQTGSGFFDLRRFWEDDRLDECRKLIMFVSANSPEAVSIAFSGADDGAIIADAIGLIFDVLLSCRIGHADSRLYDSWDRGLADLDYRLQVKSAVSSASPDTPFSVFSA